ncbi:hypothetical protein THAOC_23162 [Thalassiosira oceanica]|uniref:Uncharacterized protein n=1 Tax=Thalassiosira oceanica TaxID=159749 RepID=K0RSR3_THAOC|nr:hypothetical protein THAOC_23162 [Thalassiosira oceanica]|eukprot:EJK56863.1 hypothetical protein THAOC_23162 [Thalassiosira oceanica]
MIQEPRISSLGLTSPLGMGVGTHVGMGVGSPLGMGVGTHVGMGVGSPLGMGVGTHVGMGVGRGVAGFTGQVVTAHHGPVALMGSFLLLHPESSNMLFTSV